MALPHQNIYSLWACAVPVACGKVVTMMFGDETKGSPVSAPLLLGAQRRIFLVDSARTAAARTGDVAPQARGSDLPDFSRESNDRAAAGSAAVAARRHAVTLDTEAGGSPRMSTTSLAGLVLAGLASLFAAGAEASTPASGKSGPGSALGWVTLGTQGGPISNGERSEPANLLVVNGVPWIVDCGDGATDRLAGATDRLAGAGYTPSQINVAFISHLHIDHFGGLLALIGTRSFNGARTVLTIYGPPGTDVLVAGILQSLAPTARIQLVPGPTPEQVTRVVIVKDGSDLNVSGVRIRAVRNSHFDTSLGHPADNGSQSLSYRFDYGNYGIGYTGDTGPSDAVTRLEKGVNLLVSEVIDLRAMDASIRQAPDVVLPPRAKEAIIEHFQTQHLTPQEAGTIAARAGAQRLVLTHLSVVGTTNANARKLVSDAHETFHGEVIVARDLDRF